MSQYISREELHDALDECLNKQNFGENIPIAWDKFGTEVIHENGKLKMTVTYRVTSTTREVKTS